MAGKIQWLLCATTLGLLAQAQGEFVFYDTFQAGHDTSPNIDYAARQINGLVTSSYNLATAGRFENLQRIYDNDSDGESALSLGVFKPLGGSNSVSWTASRTATDLGSHLSGEQYAITLDSQFFNAGGNPAGFDTAFSVGILGSAGATTTPLTASSIFGIRLNGTGGGYGIYADGNLVAEQSTGSSITWAERFKLTLVVDEMLGNLLGFLEKNRLLENTLIVFTSNHGTQLGMHGLPPWEKQYPYEETIRTPFVVSGPGIKADERTDLLLSPINVMPTLCSICSVPIPTTVEGLDLFKAFQKEENAPQQDAVLIMNFSNAYGYLKEGWQWRGIRTKTHTYPRYFEGKQGLYDLKNDPFLMNNLMDDPASASLVDALEQTLQEKLEVRGDTFCECRALRHWFDSDRRIVANAFGQLPHPETEPDWNDLG